MDTDAFSPPPRRRSTPGGPNRKKRFRKDAAEAGAPKVEAPVVNAAEVEQQSEEETWQEKYGTVFSVFGLILLLIALGVGLFYSWAYASWIAVPGLLVNRFGAGLLGAKPSMTVIRD